MAAGKSTVADVLKKFTFASMSESVLSLFSLLMSVALVLYGGYALYDTFYIQNQAYSSSWDVLKYRPEVIDDDANPLSSALAAENEDYRAWLTIYDTGIDYPVMQGKDDLYYASHDIFKKSSLTGALYLSSQNKQDFSDNYNMIFGHHMDANALFGNLDHYTDAAYAKAHDEGILVTRNKVYNLRIFAVVETDAYNTTVYNVGTRAIAELVDYIRANQTYYDEAVANGAAKVLAMSTCEAAETNGRLVVFATMIERDLGGVEPVAAPEEPATPDTPVAPEEHAAPATPDEPAAPEEPAAPATPDAPAAPAAPATPAAPAATTTPVATTVAAPLPAPAAPAPGEPEAAAPQADAGAGEQPAAAEANEGGDGEEEAAPVEEAIDDDANPLAGMFRPKGASVESGWALFNLICVLATVFLLLPIGSVRDKFRRGRKMREANELHEADQDVPSYEQKKFSWRMRACVAAEVLLCVAAIVVLVLTQNFGGPMTLIDMWTPVMLLFPLVTWIVDVRLARYRSKRNGGDGDDGTATPAPAAAAA